MLATTLASLAAATAAALPAVAVADPPWTAPAAIPAAGSGAPGPAVFTPAGHGALLTAHVPGALAPTQLVTVAGDGTVTSTLPLGFVASELATYGADRIVVAGRTLAKSGPNQGTIDDSSNVVVRLGTPGALGTQRTVAGARGQQLYALASNRGGLMALVTGGLRTRSVYLRRPGATTFTRKLAIAVSNRARGATVAVGSKGDVLFVYEDAHEIRARHIGPRGRLGAVHKLGAGVQSDLQAIVNDNGRLSVAWKSQRVNEGEAATPALISYATAAPGRGFGTARLVATVGATGAGRYVAPPGVRLLAAGDDALLANTGFDGTHYTVQARQVTNGHLGAPEQLSPAGIDAVLGDAAVTANGAQLVAWRAGIAGADPSGTPASQPPAAPVLANVRPAGAPAFGGAELVSAPAADVLSAPTAALDPVTGRALVGFGAFSLAVTQIATRAAS